MPLLVPGAKSNEANRSHTPSEAKDTANEAAEKLSNFGESRREEGLGSLGEQKLSKEEADAKYEEAIEEEYAKREGGA
jgi:hypothetical protein